jgi:hypothetical protein
MVTVEKGVGEVIGESIPKFGDYMEGSMMPGDPGNTGMHIQGSRRKALGI